MKPLDSPAVSRSWRALGFPLSCCLVLLLLVSVTVVLIENCPPWSGPGTGAVTHFAGLTRYVRAHQWSADARTLAAAARYLFQAEGGVQNPSSSNRYSPLLAITNEPPVHPAA